MINIQAKIHDRFNLEMKIGYVARRTSDVNDFTVNTWLFLPNSLGLNPQTYDKEQFYRDIRSNMRLITPVFLLREIASEEALPFKNLKKALLNLASSPLQSNIAEYEYQIKMFGAILKSAVRNQIQHVAGTTIPEDREPLCRKYMEDVMKIISIYRELRMVVNAPTVEEKVFNYYLFGDEFISNVIEQHTFRLLDVLRRDHIKVYDAVHDDMVEMIRQESKYRMEMGYMTFRTDSPTYNRELIFRLGALKKYIESDLFLKARKKRDGVLVEQIYLSLAAGISMIFATAIAFSFQLKFGNFTMPLFVALVISYMLKDRIKELFRYYFAHKRSAKYFDNKTVIGVKEEVVGWNKEAFDFIPEAHAPREAMDIRNRTPLLEAENRAADEKIILYRKMVRFDYTKLSENTPYRVLGINEIIRINVSTFTQKMDNPKVPVYALDEKGYTTVMGDKTYYLNLVLQLQHENQSAYKRYRLICSREGILEIEELL